nr:uncharacterized protein LOC124813634 [Hydra vulgaris]
MKIKNDLTFEGFFCGIKYTIQSLSKNGVTKFKSYSQLEECWRYLNTLIKSNKVNVLQEHFDAMSPVIVGKKKYNPEIIIRAFEYYSLPRSLYDRLRQDYQLPSISLLQKITSKINSSFDDFKYVSEIFKKAKNNYGKKCILLIDEVFVKPSVTYCSGSLLGKAVNKPDSLASTVLSFMMVSICGGPKYLCRMLPVFELNADFLFEQANHLIGCIHKSDGELIAIICDNNRINQSFYSKFTSREPWKTESNIFLLYDFAHLIKSVRNNWLTEKTQTLKFEDDGELKSALWSDLKHLHETEKRSLVKLSKLNDVTVAPKPIERQKVSTCLPIFCEETFAALKSCSNIGKSDSTIRFIEIILKF